MAKFEVGTMVRLKARPSETPGAVTVVYNDSEEPQYHVFFGPHNARIHPERSLIADGDAQAKPSDPAERLARWDLGDARSFRGYLTLAKLDSPLTDNLYSYAASRTERLPHQFKPVLKLLESPYPRLLIADEVGLGKTIEAGIVLTELRSRGGLDNVLVTCPSNLTLKWRRELRERFDLDFEVLDGESARTAFAQAAADGSTAPLRGIASLELLRRTENLEALVDSGLRLDVVVVDEAHHLRNAGTATNQLGEELTNLADTVLFLTATPLNLGQPDFFELMRLLVPEEFPELNTFKSLIEPNQHVNAALRVLRAGWPPNYREAITQLRRVESTSQARRFRESIRYQALLAALQRGAAGDPFTRNETVQCQRDLIELNTLSHVFTRTRKREVQQYFPTRRAHTVEVEFTADERLFYDAVTDWVLAEYEDRGAHLVAITFQRMAASCLPALGHRLVETRLGGPLVLHEDEIEEIAEIEGLDTLGSLEIDLGQATMTPLDALFDAWRLYGGRVDSKFDRFQEALVESFVQGSDRIMVFSYFTGTIDYLEKRLADVRIDGQPLEIIKLYGPTPREARHRAMNRFRESAGPVVLLSSEVGSEGLDFQFCARMFNYDLPWNPMRVEQRIGRIDRYGQEADLIHILNMVVGDTVEERIFHRLYQRIRIFEESIGDLEAILGDVEVDLLGLQRDVLRGQLTRAEEDRRRNQIADAIERGKIDFEEFDRQSRLFLSNDDVFLDKFNDIERGKRYVTPDQLRELVVAYLADHHRRVRLVADESQRSGVWVLGGLGYGKLVRELLASLAREPGDARPTRAFLNRAQMADSLRVTFEPKVAMHDRNVEFISLHHPMVRAIRNARRSGEELTPTGLLQLRGEGPSAGEHCFFVFELKAQGMKDQLELLAVVINRDGEVDHELSERLLAELDQATDVHVDVPLFTEEEVGSAMGAARRHITAVVKRQEQELQALNNETVDAQVESLRLTGDRRRLRLHEQIQKASNVRIVRMREGELRRLDGEGAAKFARLEAKRGVTVGFRLVAAGALVVVVGEHSAATPDMHAY